jgi:hypothetical protein
MLPLLLVSRDSLTVFCTNQTACLPTFKPVWNATEHIYSHSHRNSAFSDDPMEEKVQPKWLESRQPLTPTSPETPGPGAQLYRYSSDVEAGVPVSDSEEED